MRPDYTTYTALELALDDHFIAFVLSPTHEERLYWNTFVEKHSSKQATLEEARELIQAIQLGLTKYTSTHLQEDVENALLAKIQQHIASDTLPLVQEPRSLFPLWIRVAAMLLLVAGVVFTVRSFSTWYPTPSDATATNVHHFEHINYGREVDTLLLPDGSRVSLFPNSKISYTPQFSDTLRKVILHGKAQFDVVKITSRPFVVFSDVLTTRVLGTTFTIKAFPEEPEVQVTVKEGKVAIDKSSETGPATSSKEEKILLEANQELTYSKRGESFTKQLVEEPQRLAAGKHLSFAYAETSLKQVLKELEQAYGIDLVYDAESIRKCQLTASLGDEKFMNKLQIICASVGLQFEVVETSIILTGKGC